MNEEYEQINNHERWINNHDYSNMKRNEYEEDYNYERGEMEWSET